MNGMEHLEGCREALGEISSYNRLLDELRRTEPRDLDSILQAQKDLRAARLRYVRALGKSVEAMAGMPEAQRAVLWQAYVLGKSNTRIADCLHFARRSVVRLKKAGKEWLEERAEQAGSAQGV